MERKREIGRKKKKGGGGGVREREREREREGGKERERREIWAIKELHSWLPGLIFVRQSSPEIPIG